MALEPFSAHNYVPQPQPHMNKAQRSPAGQAVRVPNAAALPLFLRDDDHQTAPANALWPGPARRGAVRPFPLCVCVMLRNSAAGPPFFPSSRVKRIDGWAGDKGACVRLGS